MPVKRYVKLPVVIEAIQWTGENYEEIITFCPIALLNEDIINVLTIDGNLGTISKGNYLAKGVEGEYYPIKVSVLEKTSREYSFDDVYRECFRQFCEEHKIEFDDTLEYADCLLIQIFQYRNQNIDAFEVSIHSKANCSLSFTVYKYGENYKDGHKESILYEFEESRLIHCYWAAIKYFYEDLL